jgi:hypothetical protein
MTGVRVVAHASNLFAVTTKILRIVLRARHRKTALLGVTPKKFGPQNPFTGARERRECLPYRVAIQTHQQSTVCALRGDFDRGKIAAGLRANPAAFVKSRNERPRHLTPQQKRKLLDASIKTGPGKSDREHAVAAGAHHNTATQVRHQLESTGEIASSKETVGVEGKVRTIPRKRLTRRKALAAGNRDPLEAHKTKVRDLVVKYLDDFTALVDGLCQLDPKLAELVDAAYQSSQRTSRW